MPLFYVSKYGSKSQIFFLSTIVMYHVNIASRYTYELGNEQEKKAIHQIIKRLVSYEEKLETQQLVISRKLFEKCCSHEEYFHSIWTWQSFIAIHETFSSTEFHMLDIITLMYVPGVYIDDIAFIMVNERVKLRENEFKWRETKRGRIVIMTFCNRNVNTKHNAPKSNTISMTFDWTIATPLLPLYLREFKRIITNTF